jgi:hypothetical protein
VPTPGQIARRVLGRSFTPIGDAYRRVFVDLDRIVEFLAGELPTGASILDIGGGDGAVVDRLLKRRPDLAVTMCDLAPAIGAFLSPKNRRKVSLLPATAFGDVQGRFDVVTIADVIHHVPVDQRDPFFAALAESCRRWECRKVVMKDMEPSGWRSKLALLSDWYITGDKHVVPFSRAAFARLAQTHFPQARRTSAVPDWPNYAEVLSW